MFIGWWPPHIEFDTADMLTVSKVIEEQNKQRRSK